MGNGSTRIAQKQLPLFNYRHNLASCQLWFLQTRTRGVNNVYLAYYRSSHLLDLSREIFGERLT